MDVNQVFVFKSTDAKQQNPNNKPGNFTTRFTPQVILEDNAKYYLTIIPRGRVGYEIIDSQRGA